ncbi:ABC transporter ATP-binding protein [Ancylobacter sp. Lp-2]|uniref:ABC transporter ATP-binding protein n=1 Tax=Ancylobacter sp. Lp-2 TaxID=2881339 RepID=UPI001E604916|nr:ABC transporter ATP-binding protein [Ancylobacter sp. Lp-2]MCB4770406.1 ABC transporter ATP-binding protein [Ancylobacter sp. Lp-2]
MEVNITGLGKDFDSFGGHVAALDNVNFNIERGEFYTLLGPSGCGKSTTLRCIAGLETPDRGRISIGNMVVADRGVFVPPYQRPIGMVFQSYAIWPHMTVFNNVAFPLKHGHRKVSAPERKRRVMDVLAMMQMEHLADRPAPYLSGGQQQRVALARALVSSSEVLLLDEPLSNLDAKLREDLRIEIKELTRHLGITSIYVTHDQFEALAMSDRIAVMYGGKIVQEATPVELYTNPVNDFVAQFVGRVNLFDASVVEDAREGIGRVETPYGTWRCAMPAGFSKGMSAKLAIRPESLTVAPPERAGGGNIIEGQVKKLVFFGEAVECQVQVGQQTVMTKLATNIPVSVGDPIRLEFETNVCRLLPAAGAPARSVPVKLAS